MVATTNGQAIFWVEDKAGMIKFALEYLNKWDFSVIPLLPNKKPLIKWEEYQTRKPTEKEIRGWWSTYPEAMIGIVTGEISGIAVIDVDEKGTTWVASLPINNAPSVETPRGYHFYFKYQDGITNTVNVDGRKIDIRGEGGYVVAPPSVNENRERYEWLQSLIIGLPKFPTKIFSQVEERYEKLVNDLPAPKEDTFIEGRRDNDLFHVAHHLIKGGMLPEDATTIVTRLASTCDPPFPINEAKTKVDSAVKRAVRKERPLAKEVEEWAMSTQGWFSSTEVYNCLQLSTRDEKKNVSIILRRLVDRGMLERHHNKNGWFRRIERECELIDWKHAPTREMPLKFPLGIEEYVKIYPKSIIIIAGKSDAGKTAFFLEFAKLNMNQHEIHLFINESGDSELAIRLGMFKGMLKDDWKCTFWDREDNFADVIKKDAINIIDYLDITEDFAHIGTPIKEIHNKLDKGIALIAIQKNPKYYDFKTGKYIDVDLGVGGAKSIGKSRLYLAIDDGIVKIVKAKNRRGADSPNGMTRTFAIYDGHEFSDVGCWKKPQ